MRRHLDDSRPSGSLRALLLVSGPEFQERRKTSLPETRGEMETTQRHVHNTVTHTHTLSDSLTVCAQHKSTASTLQSVRCVFVFHTL